MTTTTGVQAFGEGCHYDTMTGMTAMVTTIQDRLQERFSTMRPTTSLDYVIRQTDRLQELRLKLFRFFSHGSSAGTTTRDDTTTAEVDTAACNGNDYNNCDVSTTATSTTGSDTESTTSADADIQPTPTFTAVADNVDLISPLPDNCIHYISMIGSGKAPPPAPPAAVAGGPPGPGLMLPQAPLPQPTVFDGTTLGQWTTGQSTTTSVTVGQTDLYMAECERDSRELLQFHLCSQSYYWSHCLLSSWFTRGATSELPTSKEGEKEKEKEAKARKEVTTTKEKERAKEKENKETTRKEEEKDTTKEEKDTIKDGIHGVKEDTTTTATKDKEEEKEKEERQMLLRSVISAKSLGT